MGTPRPTYPVTITPIGYGDDEVLSTGTSETVSPLNVSTDEPESFGTVDSLSRGTGRPVTPGNDELLGPGTKIPEISAVVDQTTSRHVSPEVMSPTLGTLKPFYIVTSEPVESGFDGFQGPGTVEPQKSTPVDAVTIVPESLETFEPVDHETVRSTESNGERVESPGTVSAPLDQGTARPVDPSGFGPSSFTTSMPFSPGTIVPERSTPFDHITDVPTSSEAFRPTTRKPEDSVTKTERPSSPITFKPVKPETKTDRPAESDAGHSTPITPAVLEVTSLLDQVTDGTVTPEGISTTSYLTPRPTYPVTITPIGYEGDEILITGTSETVPPLNVSTDEPESFGTDDSLSRGTGRPVTSGNDELLGPGTRIPEISAVVDQTTSRHVSPEVLSPSVGTLKPLYIVTSAPVESGIDGFQGPETLDPQKSTPVDAVTTVPESLETFEPVDLESVRSTESNEERVESPGTVSAPLDQGIDRPVDPSSFGPSSFTTSMPFSPGTIVPERITPFDHITDGPTSSEVFRPTTRKPEDSVTETERLSSPITVKPVKPETKTDGPAESDAGRPTSHGAGIIVQGTFAPEMRPPLDQTTVKPLVPGAVRPVDSSSVDSEPQMTLYSKTESAVLSEGPSTDLADIRGTERLNMPVTVSSIMEESYVTVQDDNVSDASSNFTVIPFSEDMLLTSPKPLTSFSTQPFKNIYDVTNEPDSLSTVKTITQNETGFYSTASSDFIDSEAFEDSVTTESFKIPTDETNKVTIPPGTVIQTEPFSVMDDYTETTDFPVGTSGFLDNNGTLSSENMTVQLPVVPIPPSLIPQVFPSDLSTNAIPTRSSQCRIDSDCEDHELCQGMVCINGCTNVHCGYRAQCITMLHHPLCTCMQGHEGNPLTECLPGTRQVLFLQQGLNLIVLIHVEVLKKTFTSYSCKLMEVFF